MYLSAIDTSGREGFAAVAEASDLAAAPRLLAVTPLRGRRVSDELLPTLDRMLRSLSLGPSDLSLVVVASGPGSFTGVRVGLATAKAMAEALSTPVADVSSLAALAWGAPRPGRVLALLDALRGELFCGEYERLSDGGVRRIAETLQTRESLSELLAERSAEGLQLLVADEALRNFLVDAGWPAISVARPTPEAYLFLGLRAMAAGLCADACLLDANYLRRSEAEIVMAPKLGIPLD